MIIDRNAEVVPPRHPEPVFRKIMGSWIGQAGYDDLLASFLWVREGRLARAVRQYHEEHRARVQRELDHARHREEQGYFSQAPLHEDFTDIASYTEYDLDGELQVAERNYQEAQKVWRAMSEDYGDFDAIRERYSRDTSGGSPLMEDLAKLWDAYIDASIRVDAIMAADRNRTHAMALDEARMLAYRSSPASLSMQRIRAMHHSEFERTIAILAERDGYQVTRARGGAGDLGADVIAITPDGKTRVVIQCKHTRTGASVGSPALQRLNGTARQVHRADVVLAVTNGHYSDPARRFARSQDIALINWSTLEHWATWGVPLPEILDTL
ncbi:restriction endonuclease [Streptomyces sp. NPDC004647]|uniref:restriction endonuclease n=1 Tax=Streptomyces sp. NPDC004647 TaxID=3154671 RepID=UPI00339F73E1